jgi:poly-gamma-glutamate synthesis protein (capsule biosynthesis protein)
VEEIRSADVAITNLETVVHQFQGHAQADCGGTYLTSPPQTAAELSWAGFKMVAHANNHAFDYGTSGILETVAHVEKAGIVLAGSGVDLQRARSPRYFQTKGIVVALVATASDFIRYGQASYSRVDLPGRPGVNFLSIRPVRLIRLRPIFAMTRSRAAGSLLRPFFTDDSLSLAFSISWGRQADAADLKANLNAISEAASNAGIVISSIHAHRQGKWLTNFAHHAIDRGANVVFVHGPHQIRGIEIYRERPIFYSLGSFVFEPEHVERYPAEAYERMGLATDAPIEALRLLHDKLTSGLCRDRAVYRGFLAKITFATNRLERIRLIPIDLQFEREEKRRGRPQVASQRIGQKIVNTIASRSRRFGTRIRYNKEQNCGEVVLA